MTMIILTYLISLPSEEVAVPAMPPRPLPLDRATWATLISFATMPSFNSFVK